MKKTLAVLLTFALLIAALPLAAAARSGRLDETLAAIDSHEATLSLIS